MIAWEPLASGLRGRDPELIQIGEGFHHWISMFSHGYWKEPGLDLLRKEFEILFVHEWRLCRQNLNWAEKCIRDQEGLMKYYLFGGAVGIGGDFGLEVSESQETRSSGRILAKLEGSDINLQERIADIRDAFREDRHTTVVNLGSSLLEAFLRHILFSRNLATEIEVGRLGLGQIVGFFFSNENGIFDL